MIFATMKFISSQKRKIYIGINTAFVLFTAMSCGDVIVWRRWLRIVSGMLSKQNFFHFHFSVSL